MNNLKIYSHGASNKRVLERQRGMIFRIYRFRFQKVRSGIRESRFQIVLVVLEHAVG